MTSDEIINAMKSKSQVIYNGAVYERIIEYILWFDERGNQRRSVTLKDKNGLATVRALADKVGICEVKANDKN